MSYQVLARKWRPATFQDMVGQEHVLRALIHALDHQRLHHAYLFTGTRGVGKTTIGRLLARSLNCEQGVSSTPCGECDSCLEIRDGRFVDLIEIDAASRTKVEDMRELLDNVQYAPTRGRYKIYLIDEVHMLSGHSFNALLKTLEEPPEHVKFLLATTDPQKLPVTILSRCLQFNLKRMTPEHIVGHLRHVLSEEGVEFEEPALWLLARAADGSMRDALSLTDQAIAFSSSSLGAADVSAMLGTIDQRDIQSIITSLVHGDGPGLLNEISRIAEFSPDYSVILADLLSFFHRVTLEQVVPGSVDNAMGDAEQVRQTAQSLSGEDAQLFYQTALIGRKDLEITPDARMGFEMALLRMLAFRPGSERRERPVRQGGQESSGEQSDEPAPAPAEPAEAAPAVAEPQPKPTPAETPEPVVEVAPEPPHPAEMADYSDSSGDAPVEGREPEAPAVDEPSLEDSGQQTAPEGERGPQTDKTTPAEVDETTDAQWPKLFPEMGFKGMAGNLASESAMRKSQGVVTLIMDSGHAGLLNDRHRTQIRDILAAWYGEDLELQVEEGEPGPNTPARYSAAQKAARQAEAEESISRDPHVQNIVERFDGRIVDGSIAPTG